MDKIIFATANEGKMKEIREIFAEWKIPVISMKEAGIDIDIEETGTTFKENAVIKVKAVKRVVEERGENAIILADDSGLEIDYLGKEPGVYSARYMGEHTSYKLKNKNLIDRLTGVPDEKRTARFVCVIAAALPDGQILTSRGTIEGKIGYEERGENGFGYDPIFYLPDMSASTAELPPKEKNRISHRGKALREMEERLSSMARL